MKILSNKRFLLFFTLFGLMFAIDPAFAASTGMPWETPLETIQKSLTGPVAMVISLIGIFVAGGTLIFGGELGEFARKIVMIVLLVAFMVAGSSILSGLFTTSSAVI